MAHKITDSKRARLAHFISGALEVLVDDDGPPPAGALQHLRVAEEVPQAMRAELRRDIHAGDVVGFKVGRDLFVTRTAFDAWLQKHAVKPRPVAGAAPDDTGPANDDGDELGELIRSGAFVRPRKAGAR